jgi:predicted nucleic acid-binding protein
MIAYVDSSVLLRLVLGEPPVLKEWRSIATAVASGIVEVECLRTLDRLRLRVGVADRDLAARREAVFELLRSFESPGNPRRHPCGERVACGARARVRTSPWRPTGPHWPRRLVPQGSA